MGHGAATLWDLLDQAGLADALSATRRAHPAWAARGRYGAGLIVEAFEQPLARVEVLVDGEEQAIGGEELPIVPVGGLAPPGGRDPPVVANLADVVDVT